MNLSLRNALLVGGALALGFLVEAVAYGQQTTVYYYGQTQPVYCATAQPQQPYLRLHGNTGGTTVHTRFGSGQEVNVVQGSRSYSLETNQPAEGFAYAVEVDKHATEGSLQAIALARQIAVPLVVGNPNPQQCAPQAPYCSTSYVRRPAPYCSTSRPLCASPCATAPHWCSRTSRWCTTTGNYWCSRTNRWCASTVGPGYGVRGGSCCSGRGDGRNQMVQYAPGVPHNGCSCAANPNGTGKDCGCPPTCPECNPNDVISYGR